MNDFVLRLWTILGAFATAFWARRWIRTSRATAGSASLSAEMHAPLSGAGRLSMIIAAKDEENDIEASVRALLAQDYEDLEIIVANDRSQDRTGQILEKLAANAGGRLRVFHVAHLPPGWTGKNHALHCAIALATGDWFCFSDADCRMAPGILSLALEQARSAGADFLSLIPELECRTLWERFVQPVCVAVLLGWTRPREANNPNSKAAYANGQFMLISRACYQATGGHLSVRSELNEDVRLAQFAKRMGFRLCVVESRGLCTTRMYDSLRKIWHGWSRIFCGCSDSASQIVITAVLFALAGVLPLASVVCAAAGWWMAEPGARTGWLMAALLWACATVVQHAAVSRLYAKLRARGGAFGFVPGVLVVVAMLGNALLKRSGATAVTWRGTTYAGGASGAR